MTSEPRHPGDTPPRLAPLIGAQVSTAGGLLQAAARALDMGAEAVQIFPSNPRRWSPASFTPDDVADFRRTLEQAGLPLFVHTIYLINLASPDAALRERSVAALADALRFGDLAGAHGVVTHIGSHRGDGFDAAVPRVREGVFAAQALAAGLLPSAAVADRTPRGSRADADRGCGPLLLPPLLLESSAGSGDSLGRDPRELCILLDRLADAPAPCGLCLDTAHLFAAGFPIHTEEGLEAVLADLRSCGHLGSVGLVHLNDCRSALGSKADRHENLGEGMLGSRGLAVSVRHPDLLRVPFVLEVPGLAGHGPDRQNLERAKRLRRRAPQVRPAGGDRVAGAARPAAGGNTGSLEAGRDGGPVRRSL